MMQYLTSKTPCQPSGACTLGSRVKLKAQFSNCILVALLALTTLSSHTQAEVKLEAENQFWHKAKFESYQPGYSGKGYINPDDGVGSWVEFRFSVPTGGNYELNVRYSNGSNSQGTTDIIVNGGTQISDAVFSGTGGWAQWSNKTVIVALNAGANSVRFLSTNPSSGPNFDYMRVHNPDQPSKTGRIFRVTNEIDGEFFETCYNVDWGWIRVSCKTGRP